MPEVPDVGPLAVRAGQHQVSQHLQAGDDGRVAAIRPVGCGRRQQCGGRLAGVGELPHQDLPGAAGREEGLAAGGHAADGGDHGQIRLQELKL